MEAGKDVYCESPVSLTVDEGRRMVSTARAYGAVCQAGCQLRSDARWRRLLDRVRAGGIGSLRRIIADLEPPPVGEWQEPQIPPDHLDWDRWLGPARYTPYTPNRCHGHFRRYFDYSGGVIAD